MSNNHDFYARKMSRNLLEYHVKWAEEDLTNLRKNLDKEKRGPYHYTYDNKFDFIRYFDASDSKII